jgi:hypothetical protein
MNAPKIVIEKCGLSDSNYIKGGKKWSAAQLVEWCKEKEYVVFDLPLAGIDMTDPHFVMSSFDSFVYNCKRVYEADLQHPIILDDYGQICNGWHRVAKAILAGKTTIQAIRIEVMPEPVGYEKID